MDWREPNFSFEKFPRNISCSTADFQKETMMTEFDVSAALAKRMDRGQENGGSGWQARSVEAPSKRSPFLRFTLGFLTVVGLSASAWPFIPRHYESTATIILRSADDMGLVNHSQALKQLLDESAVQSELDVITSLPLSAEVTRDLNLTNDPEFNKTGSSWFGYASAKTPDPVRAVQSHVVASHDRKSYTVKLGYWSSDPVKATRMADALANAYLDRQVSRKQEGNARLIERLQARLIELAMREADLRRLLYNDDNGSFALAAHSDDRAAIAVELAGVRQRLVETTQRQVEVVPDAERIGDAQLPLSAAFPNPFLMAIATLLAATLIGLVLAWQALSPNLRREIRSFDGLKDRQ